MTIQEFRFWLEGYEELFQERGHPDKFRWAKIKEMLDKVVEPMPWQQSTTQWFRPYPIWSNTLQDDNSRE